MVSRNGDAKTWLVAYDIRHPRRLRRVHRCLKREGTSVQYSAFCVEGDDEQLGVVLRRVQTLIDPRADDVRAYHVPAHCRVWQLGRQQFPDGVFLEGSVVGVALPAIARDFGLGVEGLQWVVNGYLLTLSALMLLGGVLGDRYRRSRVFAAGCLAFAVTSVGCALAPSLVVLVALRLLQGVAGSTVSTMPALGMAASTVS